VGKEVQSLLKAKEGERESFFKPSSSTKTTAKQAKINQNVISTCKVLSQ